MKYKIKGFLTDLLGSARVTKRRKKIIANASTSREYNDPIREVAEIWHPAVNHLIVTAVEDVSPTARKIVFENEDGSKLPPFEAGQYVSLDLKIGETETTRPYSICSAPYEARLEEHPHIAIAVRNGKPGVGFAANWLYENAKVGMKFTAHLPFGFFYLEPLRDAKRIIGLAGGSGITPFLSMAKEIKEGRLDFDLTILYGSVSSKDIILKEELEAAECDRVKFVNVISGEKDYPGEKGFLTAELIKKYAGEGDVSYFVCGPLAMYEFVEGELKKLGVPEKRIRMEVFGAPRDITKSAGYPLGKEKETYQLKVQIGLSEQIIPARGDESIAVAMERAGIKNPTRCRSGSCGFCRCKLLEGEVYVPPVGDGRRYADKLYGYVHACSTYPLSDLAIKIDIL